jgi:acyl-CoA synthetase (NDP forming)
MNPKSIAVVGASRRMSRGTRVLLNLKQTRFSGSAYAINPRYDDVEGFACYPSVSAVPGHVDCVVVAIPAASVPDALDDAFAAGTRAAVVLSSGFGEGGHADTERVTRLRDLAARGMNICGPNCYGVLNLRTGAAAFSGAVADPLAPGPIGLVSQSGGFSNLISNPLIGDRGLGFSFLVSCGNQIGTSVEGFLEYLVEDEGTEIVAAFVEGFHQPERLGPIAARARQLEKPIIVLKSGRSEAGKAAARSHTGALAGSTEILTSLLRRHGYVQVTSIDELCETVCLFTVLKNKRPFARELVAITGSGGESSHLADAADAAGIRLADLASPTRARLETVLPDFGSASNPVDGTGAMFENADVFPDLLDAVLADPHAGVVAVNLEGRQPRGTYAPMRAFAKAVARAAPTSDKVIVTYGTSALGPIDGELVTTLHAAGVPYLAGTQRAVQAISALQEYRRYRERAEPAAPRTHPPQENLPRGVLPFLTARDLLVRFGIPVVSTELAATSDAAVTAAERLGYPVALKLAAAHKSDVGGVVLGCASPAAVRDAFDTIVANARRAAVNCVHGILVQPMAPGSVETFAGIVRDRLLGPAVVFGLGGIFVEIVRDTVIEVPPLDFGQAQDMVLAIRGRKILEGARGRAPADVDAIANVLVRLGDFALVHRDRLVSVDVNPLMVGPVGSGVLAVDALIEFE